ncbi:MAG: response regulator transcription factor [Bacteroidota bacterium]
MKILLVEDDRNFGTVLKNYLELNDYHVHLCSDGQEGVDSFQSKTYDLCILDVMMPKKDGFTVAFEIRQLNPDVPIIFLTAKTMREDMLKGFKLGADDYITKPFDSEVLLAKIKVILKRSIDETSTQKAQNDFVVGKFHLNYKLRILTIDGQQQKLSPKEADLFRLFVMNLNDVLTRDKALKSVWGRDDYFAGRSMDVYITKLRKILKQDPTLDIINVHGSGYRMVDGL